MNDFSLFEAANKQSKDVNSILNMFKRPKKFLFIIYIRAFNSYFRVEVKLFHCEMKFPLDAVVKVNAVPIDVGLYIVYW